MSNKPTKPYKIGVALSGGGARGFAHVGALRALEEFGIKPDIIAGVSAGSIVGALYASGMHYGKIISLFDNIKFNDLCEPNVPIKGLFSLNKLGNFLKKHLTINKIEDLEIPLIICATNLDKSVPVAFDSGEIIERVIASCSIPIVFNPIKINGTYYVDGGVLRNLPAWALREKCKIVIGINCSPLMTNNFNYSILDIAQRSFELMACNTSTKDAELCDILIEITDVANHKVFDLKKINDVYNCGYISTKSAVLQNKDLLDNIHNTTE